MISDETTIEQYLAIRKKAALEIDPRTAEIEWWYAQTVDPYGVRSEIPDECRQVGREYFARSPGSEVWVSFSDLPAATRDALWEKHKTKLAFAADLNGPSGKRHEMAIRKKAALEIDPRTAEIEWWYGQTVDPCGVSSEIPDECWQVGREYFARSPGSEVWVSFSDLPDEICKALWERLETRWTSFLPDMDETDAIF